MLAEHKEKKHITASTPSHPLKKTTSDQPLKREEKSNFNSDVDVQCADLESLFGDENEQ